MKKYLYALLFLLFSIAMSSQTWTPEQLTKANTAKDINYLTQTEKDAVLYINLARLYPKLFVTIELEKYYGTEKYSDYLKDSKYKKSLIEKLNSIRPAGALLPDMGCYENAKCFAKESGDNGSEGHVRTNCKEENYAAECCSYGMTNGMDIAMQWLIDDGVPGVGHRECCLRESYHKIGISVHSHITWSTCAVAEFDF
jgi:hypothetical protein